VRRVLEHPFGREFLRIVLTVGAALLLGFIITLLVSEDPIGAYRSFLLGPLSRLNRTGDWIEESITLIFLGLAVALVFKAQQFSLGAEGQLLLGALAAGAIALYVPAPGPLRIVLALAGAALAGFLWGAIPGVLKANLNASELVSSLMLNTIALKLFDYFLTYFIKPPDAGYTASELIIPAARLPSFIPDLPFLADVRALFMQQTSISIMVYILVAAIWLTYFLMFRTPFGYELRMVGQNLKFARYGGINTKKAIILATAVSGVFAGLAGAHLTMGIHNRLVLNISSGLGFEGVVVALLARNNPLAVPFAGLAYGYLRAGADVMERSSDVSREMILIIQAVIILLVTAERIMPVVQKHMRSGHSAATGTPPAAVEGGDHVA
jgi:general nucleoside transport system permease protein